MGLDWIGKGGLGRDGRDGTACDGTGWGKRGRDGMGWCVVVELEQFEQFEQWHHC